MRDYTAGYPEFGTMDDLRRLVKQAHGLGMHVIIDWVANHTAFDNPWTVRHKTNKALWKGMQDAMLFWVREADIDGFRCDVAGKVPTPLWNEARAALDKVKPALR